MYRHNASNKLRFEIFVLVLGFATRFRAAAGNAVTAWDAMNLPLMAEVALDVTGSGQWVVVRDGYGAVVTLEVEQCERTGKVFSPLAPTKRLSSLTAYCSKLLLKPNA